MYPCVTLKSPINTCNGASNSSYGLVLEIFAAKITHLKEGIIKVRLTEMGELTGGIFVAQCWK